MMKLVCWRFLLAIALFGAICSCGSSSRGLSGSLGALGTIGSGPLDAVVGPRLMARLVEGEAVRRVAEAAERECCGVTRDPTTTPLIRQYFNHSSRAVCNDNSPAGFYFRRSRNSRRWIVFLEGGWYCFDHQSCEQRWRRLRPLMTSRGWPETRQVGGILSPDPEINPHWWTANHVFVPYCSSDSWSGTRFSAKGSGDFSFMGSLIVEEVIEALIKLNLTHGHKLILAGSSAGGVGAMVNVDRVSQQLIDREIQAEVRAVSDSGWFLDNEPFAPLECLNAHSCPPVEAIRRGQELWQGRIPNSCLQEYPQHPWYCYFGYRAYPSMKSPLFIFQWVFDEAQMTVDNVGKPISKEQWDYIHGIGERLRKTFENVTALFAPSCISHTVLTKRDWANVKIGDVSLPQALYCWDVAPATRLNAKSHNRENIPLELPTTNKEQNRVRHHNRQRHRSSRRRERGKDKRKSRRRDNSEDESERQENTRDRGERTSKNHPVASDESLTDAVQSSHLVLVRSDIDRNNSASVSESVNSANSTVKGQKSKKRVKSTQANGSANTQGISEHSIQPGEMLADSPRNSVSISSKTYLVESNAIDTPQEEVQKSETEERPKRKDRRVKNNSRKARRRNKKKKKGKGKRDRKRKRKKQERRRKRRDRRRKQKENRKKRKRLKGSQTSGEESTTSQSKDDWTSDLCPAHTLHLTDRCAWPHCNYACPKLLNPFTGEEMNFIELLKSFGLDMASVANALGIDIHTLNSMGNEELLVILTQ